MMGSGIIDFVYVMIASFNLVVIPNKTYEMRSNVTFNTESVLYILKLTLG